MRRTQKHPRRQNRAYIDYTSLFVRNFNAESVHAGYGRLDTYRLSFKSHSDIVVELTHFADFDAFRHFHFESGKSGALRDVKNFCVYPELMELIFQYNAFFAHVLLGYFGFLIGQ